MASFGVVDRVRDLSFSNESDEPIQNLILGAGLFAMAALTAMQWHHIALAIASVCG